MGTSCYDKQEASFTSLHPLINEAKKSKLWLFNKNTRVWYTPEEFYDAFSGDKYNNDEMAKLLKYIIIRDPIAGIKAGHKELDDRLMKMQQETTDLRSKLEVFAKNVLIYYQDKLSKK